MPSLWLWNFREPLFEALVHDDAQDGHWIRPKLIVIRSTEMRLAPCLERFNYLSLATLRCWYSGGQAAVTRDTDPPQTLVPRVHQYWQRYTIFVETASPVSKYHCRQSFVSTLCVVRSLVTQSVTPVQNRCPSSPDLCSAIFFLTSAPLPTKN